MAPSRDDKGASKYNGNLTWDGAKTYTYNYANRLTGVSDGTDAWEYVYNGLGDRVQSILNGLATSYTLDLNTGLTQVLADGTDTYTYGLNRINQVAETQTGYFMTDALVSVRQVLSPEDEVLLAREYSPYGETVSSIGDYETDYSYTGKMTDGTGLVNLRARYYDPGTGRFISKDTWSGDYNNPITLVKWVYANGNPIIYTDPSGFKPCDNSRSDCCKIKIPTLPSSGKLSPKGEAFIKTYEQKEWWPYGDQGFQQGTCTIGYGTALFYPKIGNCSYESVHKLQDYKVTDYLTGTTKILDPSYGLSDADMEEYFDREIKIDEDSINHSITISLTQNQFDALVDYLYNTGSSKLVNERWINNKWGNTNYVNLFNHYAFTEAFYYMTFYSSLPKRRNDEEEMFFYNDYTIGPKK